jgi:hypothetical protein
MRTLIPGLKEMLRRAVQSLARFGTIEALGAEHAGFDRHAEALVPELDLSAPPEVRNRPEAGRFRIER